MPKIVKEKWEKLCKEEDNLSNYENVNFENLKITDNTNQRKNKFIRATSSLKRISHHEVYGKKKSQSCLKKTQILKGFYENERIMNIFTNFEKMKNKVNNGDEEDNCGLGGIGNHQRSVSCIVNAKGKVENSQGFENFTKRFNHLPIFCDSNRSKQRMRSLRSYSGVIKNNFSKKNLREVIDDKVTKGLNKSKSVSAWNPEFFISNKKQTLSVKKRLSRGSYGSKRTSNSLNKGYRKSMKFSEKDETDSFVLKEMEAGSSKRETSNNNIKVFKKKKTSYSVKKMKGAIEGLKEKEKRGEKRAKSSRNLLRNNRGKKYNPLVKRSKYQELELKRRNARMKNNKENIRKRRDSEDEEDMGTKRIKSKLKKYQLYDKKESIDTIDPMIKLKVDSTFLDITNIKNNTNRENKTPEIKKYTTKSPFLTPPDPELSSYEPSLLITRRTQSKEKKEENSKIIEEKNEEVERKIKLEIVENEIYEENISFKFEEEITKIENIPKFRYISKDISPLKIDVNVIRKYKKLKKILPDLEDKEINILSFGKKSDKVILQTKIIKLLQIALEREQKTRLIREKELLSMLEKTEKKVGFLEKKIEFEVKNFKFSTPKKIIENLIGMDTEDICLNRFREEEDNCIESESDDFSGEITQEERKKFDSIKNRYKKLLELDQF